MLLPQVELGGAWLQDAAAGKLCPRRFHEKLLHFKPEPVRNQSNPTLKQRFIPDEQDEWMRSVYLQWIVNCVCRIILPD